MKEEKRRHFGGKLSGFRDKAEANFEKAHLNAYLKGYKRFRHGFNNVTKEPLWWVVLETWE